jgi:uncharacterized membrane-anchored protein YhcB (DUF1043 family)
MSHEHRRQDDPQETPPEGAKKVSPRGPGRRYSDYVKQKGWWALVIGVLLQGGFMTMSWKLMNMGERQMEAERDAAQKQSDAYRVQLSSQHRELVDALKELAASNKAIAKVAQEGLEDLHKAQDDLKLEKRTLEIARAKLSKR